MKVVEKTIQSIRPYGNNPRNNEAGVDGVANSIKAFGFKQPIVVDKDNVIVAGHTRYLAAKMLGMDKLPCVVADDLTDEQIKAFRLADNKVAEKAGWNYELLDVELAEIEMDMEPFGFASVNSDDFGTDFDLPDGDKSEFVQVTFSLHQKQKELIEAAIRQVGECKETFGNENRNGNALYEVVRQWAGQRK